jgi:hypothetical protein
MADYGSIMADWPGDSPEVDGSYGRYGSFFNNVAK